MELYTKFFQLLKDNTTGINQICIPIMHSDNSMPIFRNELFYTDYKISEHDFETILYYINKYDLILYPILSQFGFEQAYQVIEIDPLVKSNDFGYKILCQFRGAQLPDDENFDSLYTIIYNKKNLDKLKKCGLNEP